MKSVTLLPRPTSVVIATDKVELATALLIWPMQHVFSLVSSADKVEIAPVD